VGCDKHQDYNQLMRTFEMVQNYVLALDSMKDELVNNAMLNCLQEILKVLPTKDFEFSFLADLLMNISHLLEVRSSKNVEIFCVRVVEAVKYHLLPYMLEVGTNGLENPARRIFMYRFLDLIQALQVKDH